MNLRQKILKPLAPILLAGAIGCSDPVRDAKLEEKAKQTGVSAMILKSTVNNTTVNADSLVKYSNQFFKASQNTIGPMTVFYSPILRLDQAGITPTMANPYHENFGSEYVIHFDRNNITFEMANPYASLSDPSLNLTVRYSPKDISLLIEKEVPAVEVSGYDIRRFGAEDVVKLYQNDVLSELAIRFPRFTTTEQIIEFDKLGTSPEEVQKFLDLNKHSVKIDIQDVVKFKQEGLTYETIEERVKGIKLDRMILE